MCWEIRTTFPERYRRNLFYRRSPKESRELKCCFEFFKRPLFLFKLHRNVKASKERQEFINIYTISKIKACYTLKYPHAVQHNKKAGLISLFHRTFHFESMVELTSHMHKLTFHLYSFNYRAFCKYHENAINIIIF